MKRALTIAGSDSGGGAGIQADLKTFTVYGVYGLSVLTALTAQNTVGVQNILELSGAFVTSQMQSVMTDIGADVVKTGMLANEEIINIVVSAIQEFKISKLVVDPVMVAKSGDRLLSSVAQKILKEKLIPLATVVTPNLAETEMLVGRPIIHLKDMKKAAVELHKSGCEWVVIKRGKFEGQDQAIDIVYNGTEFFMLKSPFYKTANTHGSGCTFSAAIAAGLAKGYTPLQAIRQAKKYVSSAIQYAPSIGQGRGPLNHSVGTKSKW
jgi:hydroxymethylpyrimidine/phosphomethylpyrimidine kinase